jgi:hypothetical protein
VKTCTVQHTDPFTCRSLRLLVQIEDAGGTLLDTPEPLRALDLAMVTSDFTVKEVDLSSPLFAEAILREFEGRLRVDEDLRKWLRAATFPAAFGCGFPEPEPDRAERSGL